MRFKEQSMCRYLGGGKKNNFLAHPQNASYQQIRAFHYCWSALFFVTLYS